MNKSFVKWFLITLFLICLPLQGYALDENQIIESAENVVSLWAKEFKKGLSIPSFSDYWSVRKFKFIECSYDIRRTDSIVSPYELIIKLGLLYSDNTTGPNANASVYKGKTYGYSTREKALKNTNEADFGEWKILKTSDDTLKIHYVLQKNNWMLKRTSELFQLNFITSTYRELMNHDILKFIEEATQIPVKNQK